MNVKAKSGKKSVPLIKESGIILKTYGPNKIPVKIYAVTSGSFNNLVKRVVKKPHKSITDMEITIKDALDKLS